MPQFPHVGAAVLWGAGVSYRGSHEGTLGGASGTTPAPTGPPPPAPSPNHHHFGAFPGVFPPFHESKGSTVGRGMTTTIFRTKQGGSMSPTLGWGLALDNPGRTVTPGGNTWPGFATSAIGIGAGQTPVCFSPPVSCFVSLPPPHKNTKTLGCNHSMAEERKFASVQKS